METPMEVPQDLVEPFVADAELPTLVDLNTADREALIALPGIGPALADRILAARPFRDLDDLQRVSGVGPALLARLEGQVTVTPVATAEEEEETPLVEPEHLEEEAEPTKSAEAPPTIASPRESPPTVTRAEALWMALGSSLLSFVLSLVVILGLLAGLNGGLRFVRPADLSALSQRVEGIQRQAESLAGDLSALRDRVNSLQNLTPRVERLETSLRATEEEVGILNAQVEMLQQQTDELSVLVDQLQQQTGLFDDFLNGLYDLLGQLLFPVVPEGGAQ